MTADAVAILGLSGRFPGADSVDAFWELLRDGRNPIRPVDASRWNTEHYRHPRAGTPGRTYTINAGLLNDPFGFDPIFFGMSPREAAFVDPQHKLLLMLAWEALEDAGIRADRIAGSDVGVYIGMSSSEHGVLGAFDLANSDSHSMTGQAVSIAANRLSYTYDLRGPSFAIDTACSSALYALNLACEDIRRGRVEMAIVGAVNLLLTPLGFVGFAKAGMLSPTGLCHAFDSRADGYVRSEMAGVMIVKSAAAARAAGDRIRAVLLGTGSNTDGRKSTMTLPSAAGQRALLDRVYREAGLHPDALAFVEAHGTGTPVGDPIEAHALGTGLAQQRSRPLPIGAVKSNVGHSETAAGFAGLTKTILALEHRFLPGNLHFERPNPNIDFAGLNLEVVSRGRPLDGENLIAGVNSFGFGGANAHAIVTVPPPVVPSVTLVPAQQALVVTAETSEALRRRAADLEAALRQGSEDDAALLVATAARRSARLSEGLVVMGAGRDELAERLAEVREKGIGAAMASGGRIDNPRIAYVFAGNGAQWAGMGTFGLLDHPAAGPVIRAVDARFQEIAGWSIVEEIGRAPAESRLNETEFAQPSLFAIQAGIVAALRAVGVVPGATLGHSVGEIAAAYVAGALDLDTALTVLYHRSRLQEPYRGRGRMAAAAVGVADLPKLPDGVGVAAENSPGSVTLVGEETLLTDYVRGLTAARRAARMLNIPYPFHSPLMDGLEAEIHAALAETRGRDDSNIGFYSSVHGARLDGSKLDADYWWLNIRRPVQWRGAVDAALRDGFNLFVEVSAQPTLLQYVAETARAAGTRARLVTTMRREQDDAHRLAVAAAEVHLADGGGSLDAWLPQTVGHVPLPRYPWEITQDREAPTEDASNLLRLGARGLFSRSHGSAEAWDAVIDLQKYPALADHAFGQAVLMPASFMLDVAATFMPLVDGANRVEDFRIAAPLLLSRDQAVLVRAQVDQEARLLTVRAKPWLGDGTWQPIFVARYVTEAGRGDRLPVPPAVVGVDISAEEHLRRCTAAGFSYGPAFRPVESITIGDTAMRARLTAEDMADSWLRNTVLMDGALQALLSVAHELAPDTSFFPVAVRRIRGRLPEAARLTATAEVTTHVREFIAADITFVDESGNPGLVLEGCVFRARPIRVTGPAGLFDEVLRPAGRRPAAGVPVRFADDLAARLAAAVGDERQEQGWTDLLRLTRVAFARDALRIAVPSGDLQAAIAGGAVLPSLAMPVEAWLAQFRNDGLLSASGYVGEDVLPSGAELWRTLLTDRPDLTIDLLGLGRAGRGLPELLQTGAAAMPGLGSAKLSQDSRQAARRLVAVLETLAAGWPADTALVIGTMGEVDGGTVDAAAVRLPHLDVEVHAGPAAPAPGTCDIVVSSLSIEAGDVAALRPGGVLVTLALEPEPLHLPVPATAATPGDWEGTAETVTGLVARIAVSRKPVPVASGAPPASPPEPVIVPPLPSASLPATPLPAGRLTVSVVGELAKQCTVSTFGSFACTVSRDTHVCFVADTIPANAAAIAPALVALRDVFATRTGDLVFVTLGAYGLAPNLAARAVIGFVRVLATEHADRNVRLIDLPLADRNWLRALADEVANDDDVPEVVLRADGRFAPKVVRRPATAHGPQRLVPAVPGSLESLEWVAAPPAAPGSGEVTIRVLATGLNFRDLMLAQGLLPSESLGLGVAGSSLGIEAAGVVEAVGPDVGHLAVGDFVVAYGSGLAATHATVRADLVLSLPRAVTPEAAATLTTAFITALHCLEDRAHLEPGEKVLIHAASGGLGIAALQVAARRGATLIATAGADDKRDVLALLGLEHVFASRNISFSDDIRARFGERPVDVVLNSLTGELTRQSIDLLKPFGRFVEVGKRDVLNDVKLSSLALKDNIALHVVDADQLPSLRRDLTRQLLERIGEGLGDGSLRPLPHLVVPAEDTIGAFRTLQGAQHIGKIVLIPPPVTEPVPARALPDAGAVVITGGLSGLGLDTAVALADAGLRDLVLWSRSGTAENAEKLDAMRARGVAIEIAAVDVGDPAAVAAALAAVRAGRPIVGIVHAAGVYDDAPASELDEARIAAVLRAKIDGAMHLDAATADDPLAFFVLFSSVTVALGNPGQSSYVAANAALEALAQRRRAEGLPGLAVAWGPARTGRLFRDERLLEALERRLGRPVPTPESLLAALPALIRQDGPATALVVDWEPGAFRGGLPPSGSARFSAFPAVLRGTAQSAAMLEELATMPEAERLEAVTTLLTGHVARILRLAAERIDSDSRLADIGFDSLMAVELGVALEEAFGRNMRIATGADLTLRDLAGQIARSIGGTGDYLQSVVERHETGLSATE